MAIAAKRILKQIDVSFISLVNKGANRKTIVWKSDDAPQITHDKVIPITKTDDEQRLVYGIVYSPDEVDSQGDTATAKVIKSAAHTFMKALRATNIDRQHDFVAGQGYVAESWITRKNDDLFPSDPIGSWAVAIHVDNEDTWDAVKSGSISGLSLAGVALGEVVEKEQPADGGILQRIRTLLNHDSTQKDFNSEVKERTMRDNVYALMEAIDKINRDDTVADKTAAINLSIDQFKASVQKSDDEPIALEKVGKAISAKNLAAIKGAMENLMSLINTAESADTTKAEETMNEEIQKAIDTAVAKALEPITAALQKAETDNTALQTKITELEKSTPGSTQIQKDNNGGEQPVRMWL